MKPKKSQKEKCFCKHLYKEAEPCTACIKNQYHDQFTDWLRYAVEPLKEVVKKWDIENLVEIEGKSKEIVLPLIESAIQETLRRLEEE